jgi:putative transposase
MPTFTTTNSYFFTIRLAPRSGDLLLRHIDTLRRAMRYTLSHHPVRIDAMAVLPDVIHALWTLPDGDHDYPNRIGMFKARFSRAMEMPVDRTLKQIQRGEKGIWERRYWEHQITDAADFARHRDLIHLSPVHAGLCATPLDWPNSSIHRDMTRGLPPPHVQDPVSPCAQGPAAMPPKAAQLQLGTALLI